MARGLVGRCLLALLSGLCLSAAFEPLAQPWLIPFSVAGLVISVYRLPATRAWIPGVVYGIGFQFSLLWWMRAIGPDAWLALSGLEALFFAPLGSALAVISAARYWPLWTAAAWVVTEELRSRFPFGGMPWGRLAYASIDTSVAGWLPWVGATGTGLVWATVGATMAWWAVEGMRRRRLALAGALAVGGLIGLPMAIPYSPSPSGEIVVAAVQGGVPGDGTDVLFDHRQVTANHVRATRALADEVADGRVEPPDLVIWPENSTAVDPFTDPDVNAGIAQANAAIETPLLLGAIVQGVEPDQVLNQGILWDPDSGAADRYTKRHPVAYGEYIPFRRQLPWTANFGRLREIGRDMLAGVRTEPLTVDGTRLANAICFDVAYDDGIGDQVRSGSDLITVQTSNAMFIETAQVDQQFAISRVRAIEARKYVVVAAMNGVSGVIDDRGNVVSRADLLVTDVLVERVPKLGRVTLGVRLGESIGYACLALTAIGLMLGGLGYRRGRGDTRSAASAE
ncbi:MAG: apolipoprotein N-acyltransferase [Nocardioides sp.]